MVIYIIDNIYFYKMRRRRWRKSTEPNKPAPTPTQNESDVISLFSDSYTDVTVDTWRTEWSVAELEDVSIAGNALKCIQRLDFAGN